MTISDARIRELAQQGAQAAATMAVRHLTFSDFYELMANAPELRGWPYETRAEYAKQAAKIASQADVTAALPEPPEVDQ